MQGIELSIKNIKNINEFEIIIPDEKGLYALTGENGSGKSTIIACAGSAFYNAPFIDYFGQPNDNSIIEFKYKNNNKIIEAKHGEWVSKGDLHVTGFYEGSIFFGTRFINMNFKLIRKLSKITEKDLIKASEFVISHLGEVLRDDKNYYSDLYVLDMNVARKRYIKRMTYFYKNKNTLINQINMSTGENLLLSILQSIEKRIKNENYGDAPTFLFLDELELALHSSAQRRLVFLLKDIAEKYNMVVLFSTHSIEIIRSIPQTNIYYLQEYGNGVLKVMNPCSPIYATRNLESANYGYDCIILVEDDLSKKIIDRILLDEKLLSNKRIMVIPIGGWTQVIKFAHEAIKSNLMIKITKVIVVLDKDIQEEVKKFMKNEHIAFSDDPQYLPVKSLEKFLLSELIEHVDTNLYDELNDYIFQETPLKDLIHLYKEKINLNKFDKEKIKNGKAFYSILNDELHRIRKNSDDLVTIIVRYLFDSNNKDIVTLKNYFVEKFKNF